MNSNYNDFSILDILNIFSVGLQVMTLEQTTNQISTDDIMRELQRQDREYMEKIIAQNNKILEKYVIDGEKADDLTAAVIGANANEQYKKIKQNIIKTLKIEEE